MRSRLWIPAILLAFFLPWLAVSAAQGEDADRSKLDQIAREFEEADGLRCDELASRLERSGKVAVIQKLATGNSKNAAIACGLLVRMLPAKDAVFFCTTLKLGSAHWLAAFLGLQNHHRDSVIGYIQQVARIDDLTVRWACYMVCMYNKWADLKKLAFKDLYSKEPVILRGAGPLNTLGVMAAEYLRSLGEDIPTKPNADNPLEPDLDKLRERGAKDF